VDILLKSNTNGRKDKFQTCVHVSRDILTM